VSDWGPLPDDGQQIIGYQCREDQWLEGRVSVVWLAMDTVCINVQTARGTRHLFPEFGDIWGPA
jgi:hypothetical protein